MDTGQKHVNLALQGGGSHGAFAWGVVDKLLDEARIVIEGVVGTSAGAMNATVVAHGLMEGGNDGARKALRRFWQAVSAKGACSIMQPSWVDRLKGPGSVNFSPGWMILDFYSRMFSVSIVASRSW